MAATRKKTDAVAKAKKQVSNTFLKLVLMYFFLRRPNLVLTSMKPAPRTPEIAPRMIADGRLEIGETSCVTSPNLRTEALVRVTSLPSYKFVRIASVSVLIAEAKKTSQSMLKVQNVVGLEIS